MAKEKYPSETEEKDIGKNEEKYMSSARDKVTLVFKQYRTFELHIGADVYIFRGNDPVEVPASVIMHKDFTSEIADLFLIK